MGHRLELYVPEHIADELIQISKSFGVDAKRVGRVEKMEGETVSISSEFGNFKYSSH